MRQRTIRRMLAVVTGENYRPSEADREVVVLLKMNDVSHERIAQAIGVNKLTLEYWYAKELDFGVDAILAHCAKRMIWLANQNQDLGVSLRANQALLQPRVKSWREPHVDVLTSIGDISDQTLEQVEADIERLERQRRAATATEEAAARADPDQAESA
ncbi:MAG: hypothetical protein ABWY63_14330 [Hyphomicrobiaceae bacterium]